MPTFDKVLVANRGEIAVRIFRTLRELGLGCVAVYSDADRGRQHAEVADEAYRIGPGPAAESYLLIDVLVETALRAGRRGDPPGLRLPRRERGVRPGGRGRRARLDRPAARGDRADGLEDRGAYRDEGGGRPDHPGRHEAGRVGRRDRGARRRGRLPADRQGGGGRRRQGDEAGRGAGGGREGLRVGQARGPEVLRRRRRVRRALPRRPASRRGAGAGRRSRQRDPPRRARLHDPAPPPEADRGDAVAGRHRRAARPDRPDRGRRRARGRATGRPGRSRGS